MRKLTKFDGGRLSEISHIVKKRAMTPDVEKLHVGVQFGLYNEEIERIEIGLSAEKTPKWFDPRSHPGHLAVHAQDGRCAYIALTVDRERRKRAHPFDNIISANAVRKTEQLNLLTQIQNG